MSLATRCSACGTVFRVVQDQLKVSEGWVRCGRCNEVFNALEGLFDLDREAPPEWEPQEREDWAKQGVNVRADAPDGPDAPDAPDYGDIGDVPGIADDPHLVEKIGTELFGERTSARASSPTFGSDADAPRDGPPMFADDEAADAARRQAALDGPADDPAAPDFLRKAEREERWTRPSVRLALAALSLVLLAALGLQAAHHFRDDVAARWPEAMPVVAAWCDAVGCRVGPPRHIEEIAVESTALSRVGNTDAYRLSVVLRNHGMVAMAMPSIDLALTDGSGQLIARRTLDALEFVSAPGRVAPGGETSLQTLLTAGPARITGYTVEVFYP